MLQGDVQALWVFCLEVFGDFCFWHVCAKQNVDCMIPDVFFSEV